MLKRKLLQEVYDALDENLKPLYKVNPSRAGEFLLEVEPDADNSTLKRAKDIEKTRADTAEARVAELEAEVEGLNTQVTTLTANKPDVEKLGAEYKKKEEALKTKHAAELKAKDDKLALVLVDQKAHEMAAKISNTPELLVGVIKKRLKANITGEEPVTEVLDGEGLVSSATIADLEKEFVANPKYSAIIIGSNGSGSGAQPNKGGSGATYKGKKFSDLSEAERTEWHKTDAAGFKAASDANRNAKF